jgi:hypothetical protein
MVNCTVCKQTISRDDPVSAAFTQEGHRSYFHKNCEEKAEHFTRWKEEAPWAFKPTRLTVAEWRNCSSKKHLGVWQSMFIARRDEDIWCPDCGLKIFRHESLNCPSCGGPAIITAAETTKMVFTHHEPLFKLILHCTEKGEQSSTFAIVSGFTPVTITARKKGESISQQGPTMMLEYEPKENLRKGLTV